MIRSQQQRDESVPRRVRFQAFASKHLTRPTPHRILYRISGGRLGGALPGVQPRVLLLTVVGRHSGRARTTPLVYFAIDGQLAVAATNSGAETDPAWIANLRTQPHAEIQIGATKRHVVAREADGDERRRVWTEMKRSHPLFQLYERDIARQIPVVLLETCPTCPPLYAGLVGVKASLGGVRDPDTVVEDTIAGRIKEQLDARPGRAQAGRGSRSGA